MNRNEISRLKLNPSKKLRRDIIAKILANHPELTEDIVMIKLLSDNIQVQKNNISVSRARKEVKTYTTKDYGIGW